MTRSLSILFLCEAHSTVTLGMITVRPFFKNRPRSCVCPFRGEPLTERLTPPRRLIANRTPNNMAIDLAKQKENRSISKRKGLLNLRLYNRLLLLRPPTRGTSEIPYIVGLCYQNLPFFDHSLKISTLWLCAA